MSSPSSPSPSVSSSSSSSSVRSFFLGILVGISSCFLLLFVSNQDYHAPSSLSSLGLQMPTAHADVDDDNAAALSRQSFEFVVTDSIKECQISEEDWQGWTHFQVNAIRRYLALHHKDCYRQHEATLVRLYREFRHGTTPERQEMYLHIPKTGGTSVCEMAKSNGSRLTVENPNDNCWIAEYFPVWMHGQFHEVQAADNCQDLSRDHSSTTFMVNEQYLRFPLCEKWLYALSMRPSVDRVMSHVRHLMDVHKDMKERNLERRLNLIQSNFMSWMLVAGQQPKALLFRVPASPLDDEYHAILQQAMETVNQFDFLLNLYDNATIVGDNNDSVLCQDVTVQEMGLLQRGESIPRANVYHDPQVKKAYHAAVYAQINVMDEALYQHFFKLSRVDCEFHGQQIWGENDKDKR